MDKGKLQKRLINKGLRVTSRRLAILEAIIELKHPTAEDILKHIRKDNPGTATATVYKALNILAGKEVIIKVNTEKDITRYDALLDAHHHLYSNESDRIENYYDDELSGILEKYFKHKRIPGFNIERFNIQIIGKFAENKFNNLKTGKDE